MSKKNVAILHIDDDVHLTEIFNELFASAGYRALAANDPMTGLKLAKKDLPDLILLDITMPGKDGFEVLEELKRDKSTKDIPVVMLSTLGSKEYIERAFELGALRYIVKSHAAPEEVVADINEILKESNADI